MNSHPEHGGMPSAIMQHYVSQLGLTTFPKNIGHASMLAGF